MLLALHGYGSAKLQESDAKNTNFNAIKLLNRLNIWNCNNPVARKCMPSMTRSMNSITMKRLNNVLQPKRPDLILEAQDTPIEGTK